MNFFVSKENIKSNYIYIENSDVNHIKNVLRKNVGDMLDVVSDNIKYKVEITNISSNKIEGLILEELREEATRIKLTIFQGLAKADKFEYIIQKCTELGVHKIVPVEMKRCVVRLEDRDKKKKMNRWQKIAEVASKQSLRTDILMVDKILPFEDMLLELKKYDLVVVAYEGEKELTLKEVLKNINKDVSNIAVIVGPEGGIEEQEINKLCQIGARIVTLGNRILRTETAPVAISAMIMYELEY